MADSQTVEDLIKSKALEMGADAVGIAAVSEFHKICPEGNRPDDLLKGAKSVITVGKRRYGTGQWLTSNTDLIHRARTGQGNRDSIAAALAGICESEYGYPAVVITPGMFDTGMVPPLSLKVCAELSGLGTRSMAGGIILSKEHGLMGFAVAITTMELKPDGPLSAPVCPERSCIASYAKDGTTPCMKSCSAIEGKIENGRLKEVKYYRSLCATRALTTMNAAYLRLLPDIVGEEDPDKRKHLAIGQARKYIEDPPGRGIWGRCIECMRVCPVNRRSIRLKKKKPADEGIQANA
jgi:epoxyqueuosine reductase QueG